LDPKRHFDASQATRVGGAPIREDRQSQFERRWRSLERLGSEADIHWIDAQGSPVAISRYNVGDILVSLVRPDGYIGFQTDRLEV
jgi:hypothetical protein